MIEVNDKELALAAELRHGLTSIDAVVLPQEGGSAPTKATALFACGLGNGAIQILGN